MIKTKTAILLRLLTLSKFLSLRTRQLIKTTQMESRLNSPTSNHSKKLPMQTVSWRVKTEKRALLSILIETRLDKSRFRSLYRLHQKSKNTNSWKALRVNKLSLVAQQWQQEDPLSCPSLKTRKIQRTPCLKSGTFLKKNKSVRATVSHNSPTQLNYQSNLPIEAQAQREWRVLAIEVLRAPKSAPNSKSERHR